MALISRATVNLCLMGGLALAEPYNLWSLNVTNQMSPSRVWFGDGQFIPQLHVPFLHMVPFFVLTCYASPVGKAYVGERIPSEVRVALNVSGPGDRADIVYLVANNTAATPSSMPSGLLLPDPTFLAIRMAPNSSDPVFLAHSAAMDLTPTDNYLWASYSGYLLPRPTANMKGGGFYLLPTNVEGTWSMRFIMSDETAKLLGAVRTHLYTGAHRAVS